MTEPIYPDNSVVYEFGDFILDPDSRELRQAGELIPVENKVMDVLLCLIRHRDRVVSKDEIQDAVWPGTIVTETALTRGIMKARRAIEDSADEQTYIKTIHGRGYRFIENVTESSRSTRQQNQENPAVAKSGVTISILALVATLLIIAALTLIILQRDPGPTPADTPISPGKAIAVLPFDNLSPNPDHAYFATGIQEEILNEIARKTELQVYARASVARYADRTKSIQEIAGELGVDSLVEGSVRYSDNRVRISAQLIDGRTGLQLWSNIYDREFAGIFEIQSDIAQKVAQSLEAEILGSNQQEQSNVQAYQEYLLASSMRYRTFQVGWDPVLEHVRRSLSYDPQFIPSLAILHNAYQNRIINNDHGASNLEMQTITAKARLRDPNHALTLAMQAKDAAYQWQWDESARFWELALSKDVTDPDNIGTAAFVFIGAGKYARAQEITARGIKDNPRHDWPLYADMLLKIIAQDVTGSHDTGRLIISMGGNRAFPAAVTLALYNARIHQTDAVNEFGRTINQMTNNALAPFTELLVKHANGEDVPVASIQAIVDANPPPNTYKWMVVQYYLLIGETDMAFEAIDDIRTSHALFSVLRIVSDPAYAEIHNDPRYLDFLDRVGLTSRGR